jgi:glycosyltransferase involved in cell wall biosynthesis
MGEYSHGDPEPKVSVVVPTHDRGPLLERTLASVVRQRGVALEIVVVDDGSTDDTTRRLDALGDERLRVVRNERAEGVSRARNRGIAEARGEWLAFCDDDDVWAPDKLAAQVEAAGAAGAPWAYAGHVNISAEDRVIGGAPPSPPDVVRRELPRTNLIPGGGSNVLARAALVREVGSFDERLGILEDWDLWIRLARDAAPAWVPRPLIGYRVHAENSSRNIDRMLAELDVLDERYRGPVDRVRFEAHLARVSLRSGDRSNAVRFTVRAAVRAVAARDVRTLRSELVPGAGAVAKAFAPASIRARLPRRRPPGPEIDEWQAVAAAWVAELPGPAPAPPA